VTSLFVLPFFIWSIASKFEKEKTKEISDQERDILKDVSSDESYDNYYNYLDCPSEILSSLYLPVFAQLYPPLVSCFSLVFEQLSITNNNLSSDNIANVVDVNDPSYYLGILLRLDHSNKNEIKKKVSQFSTHDTINKMNIIFMEEFDEDELEFWDLRKKLGEIK
jgi:hypothetical protein